MQVWILDSNIGKVTLNKDAPSDVDRVIREIKGLQHPIASREWLYKFMEDQGYSLGLSLWMGSNLVPDGQGKLKWGFNIEGASGETAHMLRFRTLLQIKQYAHIMFQSKCMLSTYCARADETLRLVISQVPHLELYWSTVKVSGCSTFIVNMPDTCHNRRVHACVAVVCITHACI